MKTKRLIFICMLLSAFLLGQLFCDNPVKVRIDEETGLIKKDFPGWGDSERLFVDLYRAKLVETFGREAIDALINEAWIEARVRKAPCDHYCDPISHIVGCPPPTVAK